MFFANFHTVPGKKVYLFTQLFWFVITIILFSVRAKLIEIYELLNRHSVITSDIIYLVPAIFLLFLCVIYSSLSNNDNISHERIIKLLSYFSIVCGIFFLMYIFYCMNVLIIVSKTT